MFGGVDHGSYAYVEAALEGRKGGVMTLAVFKTYPTPPVVHNSQGHKYQLTMNILSHIIPYN